MKLLRNSFVYVLSILLIFSFSFDLYSQKKTVQIEQTVVAKAGNRKITFAELEKAYSKNLTKTESSLYKLDKDSLLDFINMYIDYRLKVQDAKSRGYEKDSAVQAEIKQNRRMLAESFFYNKKLIGPNVNEVLLRREQEVQIAIIVKTFPPDNGTGIDTLPTYLRAKEILDSLTTKGADFATVAEYSSDDSETAKNGGLVINYITSGRTQRPIDTVIFKLKEGEIYPELIRIRDGYLIIKLVKKQKRKFVKLSHILLSNGIAEDSMAVVRKADSLIQLLKKGADFAELAEENSDDPASAIRGGSMGDWYSRSTGFANNGRSLLPNFEDAVFALKDGEISGIVVTEYGIHIIKRDSTRGMNEKMERNELKKLYRRVYYDSDKQDFLNKIKELLGYKIHFNVLSELVSKLDTTKTTMQDNWDKNIDDALSNKILYEVAGKSYTVGNFVTVLKTQRQYRGTATNIIGLKNSIDRLTDPVAFDKATENLEKEYSEFADLISEFRDGILLFKVAADEVWDKLKFDSTAAYKFWEPRKNKYKTFIKYDLTEVYVLADTVAKGIYKYAKEGTDIEKLAEQYTQRKGYREKKGNWGLVSTKDNKLALAVMNRNPKEGEIISPFPFEDGFSVVKVNKILPSRTKTFEEAIPDFAPEYQEMIQKKLETEWMTRLRKKYGAAIYQKTLNKVINTLKKRNK
jgi:peptidyl-prolyl cis-trans isomerase SurA